MNVVCMKSYKPVVVEIQYEKNRSTLNTGVKLCALCSVVGHGGEESAFGETVDTVTYISLIE